MVTPNFAIVNQSPEDILLRENWCALDEILLFESPISIFLLRKFGISTCSAPKLVKLFLSLGIVIEVVKLVIPVAVVLGEIAPITKVLFIFQ